jgi:hypothetical protein
MISVDGSSHVFSEWRRPGHRVDLLIIHACSVLQRGLCACRILFAVARMNTWPFVDNSSWSFGFGMTDKVLVAQVLLEINAMQFIPTIIAIHLPGMSSLCIETILVAGRWLRILEIEID